MSDNGGPAFPVAAWSNDRLRYVDDGMTLRDYFAAKAMVAMLSAYPCQAIDREDGGKSADFDCIAGDAYACADAMLRARAQERTE